MKFCHSHKQGFFTQRTIKPLRFHSTLTRPSKIRFHHTVHFVDPVLAPHLRVRGNPIL